MSPTINLFITPSDYVKMLKEFDKYFDPDAPITQAVTDKRYPVGDIYGCKIYFMHYSSCQEAEEKWNRRKNRIDFSNIVFMYCENEGCEREDILNLVSLENKNKLCFTYNPYDIEGAIFSKEVFEAQGHPWKPEIVMSMIDWKKYLNELNK